MIYFDNSATTPLSTGAIKGMRHAIEQYGNPSSLHFMGLAGAEIKKEAKETLLRTLKTKKEQYEVVFTSGGTEANNLAIFGAARAKRFKEPKIIITDSEHACVMEPCARLEQKGFRIVRLATVGGKIDEEQFCAEMDEHTVLVSLMSVNNETGAVYNVKKMFDYAHRVHDKVVCHTDGVQAFLKIPFTPATTGADLLTLSAHKVHGPKGCGALLVSKELIKRKALLPLLCGGGQEGGLRSGTENTIGIAGFAGAVAEQAENCLANAEKTEDLRQYLIESLPGEIRPNIPEQPAPHILSITLPQIKSETALHFLSSKGICVSSGSACSSNGGHKSYVLTAFGLTPREADCTLRVSLSAENTKDEVDEFCAVLAEGLGRLVRMK